MKKYPPEILMEVQQRLLNDQQFMFKKADHTLRHGVCQNCQQKTCFIDLNEPYYVKCGRLKTCDWGQSVRKLYPEIFDNLYNRYKETDTDPNAPADAYLRINRGFDLTKIKGMYSFAYRKNKYTDELYPAVKVRITEDIYWLRLINASDIPKNKAPGDEKGAKTNIIRKDDASYSGLAWIPPNMKFQKNDEIWITEGIFKSMAFLHIGEKSIASLSCQNFPRDIIKNNRGKNITWILAYDNDAACHRKVPKYVEELKELGERYRIAYPQYEGTDWDDEYRIGKLTKSYLNESFYRGFIQHAQDYKTAAMLLFAKKNQDRDQEKAFHVFHFKNELYCYEIKPEIFEKLNLEFSLPDTGGGWNVDMACISQATEVFCKHVEIHRICNAWPKFIYQEENIIDGSIRVNFQIRYPNSLPPKMFNTTGDNTIVAKTFASWLAKSAGMVKFKGNEKALDYLYNQWTSQSHMTIVHGVPFIGYSREHKAYIFKEFCYKDGIFYPNNEYQYSTLDKVNLKTNLPVCPRGIVPDPAPFDPSWFEDYCRLFDMNGVILLGWWLGTLFAEQIRAKFRFWPFMECSGAPGSGKSTQIQFLWKILGSAGMEGFDPNKTSFPGLCREMAKLGNFPCVLLEGDHDKDSNLKQKGFSFDSFKDQFEGGFLRIVGVSGGTNQTEQIIFRGGILVAQNAEVVGQEALLERIIHNQYKLIDFTDEARGLARRMEAMTPDQLGGFLHKVLKLEKSLFDGFCRQFPLMVEHYNVLHKRDGGCRKMRLRENHAMIASWIKLFPEIFGKYAPKTVVDAAIAELWNRCQMQYRRSSGDDPVLSRFWEAFDYLNTQYWDNRPVDLNHEKKGGNLIAFNLTEVRNIANNLKVNLPDDAALYEHFKASRKCKFIAYKLIKSKRVKDLAVKCWIFEREMVDENENRE